MSINNATPADWDRLREKHPALEVSKPTIDEQMKVYLDAAEEEINKVVKETEWWKQHIENLERVNKEEKEMQKEELESQIFYEEEDMVGAPRHYNTGAVECIVAIEESMSSVAFKGYLKGNAMKYLWRYDYKGKQVEDLQKCQWYLAKLTQVVVFENGDNS